MRNRGDRRPTRVARQPGRHHRNRAGDPQADARCDDRRSPQPPARHRVRLRRPARLAARRPLLVDRLGPVEPHQFLAAHRARLRAAEHGDGRRGRRCVAVDALRRQRRADCRRRRPAVATVGLSAVFFQDPFGLITFDSGFAAPGGVRPRTGKGHVVHCLDAYQRQRGRRACTAHRTASARRSSGYVRNRRSCRSSPTSYSMSRSKCSRNWRCVEGDARCVPGADRQRVRVRRAASSSGWIDTVDVETGESRDLLALRCHAARRTRPRMAGRCPAAGQRPRPRRHQHRPGSRRRRTSR